MRIGFVIGGLGRGGAELQMLQLADGLVRRGHEVHALAYDGPGVLDERFRAAGVDLLAERSTTRLQKVVAVRRWMRRTRVDVVHAVMKRASSVSLLARGLRRRTAVVATDFSTATYGAGKPVLWGSLVAFAFADRVVTETDRNRDSLVRMAPWLRTKTKVVRNGLDTDRFRPGEARARPGDGAVFRFCVVGTIAKAKNPIRVIEAVRALRERGHSAFRVDWYGRDGHSPATDLGARARAHADACGVADIVVFHGDTPDIVDAYRRADALLHVSVQEGIANALVEGMACGLPIVVSRISDFPQIVERAQNGFMADPNDVASIADAMARLMALSFDDRVDMGRRSRDIAVRWFHRDRFVDEHETLYRELVGDGER